MQPDMSCRHWQCMHFLHKLNFCPVRLLPTVGSDRRVAAKMAALHTAAQERGPPVRSRNGRDAQFGTRMNGRTGRSTGWGETPIS